MSDTGQVTVIIPFRDRGIDLRRAANLEVVQGWWYGHGFDPHIVDDGLEGDAQFNRHRAYNRAVERFPETEVFIFTEADMLIHPEQIKRAVKLARRKAGLVVPFDQYRYLSDEMTAAVRDRFHDFTIAALAAWWSFPVWARDSVFQWHPESIIAGGRSIGAVNVIHAEALRRTGGFTEATSGNWYDDRITEEGFAFLLGQRTRFVPGPAVHLYHLPGWKGEHLTTADREATEQNRLMLEAMRECIRMRDHKRVRQLMEVRA